MKKILALIYCAAAVAFLSAVEENTLQTEYQRTIVPHIEENGEIGKIQMQDEAVLQYLQINNNDRTTALVFLGGHTESYVKYYELFYDIRDIGATIYALDLRGQGFSDRMLPDREKDHIDSYEIYIQDLNHFMKEVVAAGNHARVIILGCSLGGAVAAGYAEQYPDTISGLILSSPYLSTTANSFVMFFLRVLNFFGAGKKYVPGGGPYEPVPFEENKETHSRERHERKLKDYEENPSLRLGYPTIRWMVETEKMGRKVRKNAKLITSPILVFQAEYDEYADHADQNKFCSAAGNCTKIFLEDAYHELLIERDSTRDKVLMHIRDFIENIK